jgi:hypothetical protein
MRNLTEEPVPFTAVFASGGNRGTGSTHMEMRTMERWRRLLRLATLRGDLAAKAILEGRIAAAMALTECEKRMMWGDR